MAVARTPVEPPRLRVDDRAVARPRVSDAVQATAPGSCVLLIAPPGYGATTALVHATADPGTQVAWADLSGRSDDEAVARIQAALSPMTEPPSTDAPDDRWLVVDALDAGRQPRAARLVAEVAATLPPQTRLAVAGHDPGIGALPWPLTTMRIGPGALALTPDESVEVLLTHAPGLDDRDIDELLALADGWVAAIAAAARHAAVDPRLSPTLWLQNEGAELLLGGWFDDLPADVRDLLMRTVVLDALSTDACEALNGADGVAAFRWLTQHSAYVDRLPDDGGQTRLTRHPMLTHLLRARTARLNLTDAHREAARWHASQGRISQAVDQLLAAGLAREAGELVRAHEDAAIEGGASKEVHSWYASLPAEALGSDIEHVMRVAWSRALTGDRQGATLAAEQLALRLDALNDPTARGTEGLSYAGQHSLLRAYIALAVGDPGSAVLLARRAMDEFLGDPQRNAQQLAPILLIRGLLWSGDTTAAKRELDSLSARSLPTDALRESLARGLRAQVLAIEGRIREAAVLTRAAAHWHATQGIDAVDAGQFSAPVAEAMVAIESGDPASGRDALIQVVDTSIERQMVGQAAFAMAWLARAEGATGRLGDGLRTIARARAILADASPGSSLNVVLSRHEAWLRILSGDAPRAERLVALLPASVDRTLLWCRLSLSTSPVSVERTLMALEPQTPRHAVEARLLLASLSLRNSPRLAEVHLVRAADVADDHGLELAFLGLPSALVDLAEAVGRRTAHDALLRLAAVARLATPNDRPGSSPDTDRVPLSPGEIELIRLLPGRLTITQIAETLGVSANTIKTRVQRLYRKLGVRGRNEAVEAARLRGLLE